MRSCTGRMIGQLALGLAILGMATSSVSAQGRGGQRGFGGFGGGFGGFGGGGKVGLVSSEQVQTELKLTDEQKKTIEEVSRSYRESTRNLVPREGLSREEMRKKFEETAGERQKLSTEADAKVDAALNADQVKRLDEIQVRLGGVNALRGDKLAAKLGLSADQKTKIAGVLDEQQKKMREAFTPGGEGGRPDFNAIREKMTTLRKETDDQVGAILTSEQKQKWEEAKGAEFEFRRGGGRIRGGQRPATENAPKAKESDL